MTGMSFRIAKKLIYIVFLVLFVATHGTNGDEDDEIVKLELKLSETESEKYKTESQRFEEINYFLQNRSVIDVCAKGTWVLYDDAHLINMNPSTLEGITILTTDEDQCFPYNEIGHELQSLQHVTSYNKRKANTIIFFEYENFIGRKIFVNKPIKPSNALPGYYNLVKSVITIGKQEWVVVFDGPIRVCFKPPTHLTTPVCLISNLIDDDNLVDSGVLQVYHPGRNSCNESNALIVNMTYCFENSAGLIHPNASWAFGPPNGTTDGSGEVICNNGDEILDQDHIELIAGRLNGSLGKGDWFKAIKNPKNIWKTELFDKCFQVLSKICPNSVIDSEYLTLFASLYFFHLEKIWESGKFLNVTIPDVSWMELTHDMNSCISTVSSGDYDAIAAETTQAMKTYTSLDGITGKIERMLGFRKENDHVMEINWLMANLVASICTKARNFDVNFLPRFLNAFHVLYFSPIEAQWMEPKEYSKIYTYLFGGYGMQKSLTKIALCTYNAMQFSGVTEPYKRPMEQADKVLLPKVEVRR